MLTLRDKKSIDLLVPLAVAGVTGFIVFRRGSKDWRMLAAAVIGAFIIMYAVTTQVTKRIYDRGPADVPTGGTCGNYNPQALADAIYSDVTCTWCLRDHSLYTQLIGLNDCQIKSLYN